MAESETILQFTGVPWNYNAQALGKVNILAFVIMFAADLVLQLCEVRIRMIVVRRIG